MPGLNVFFLILWQGLVLAASNAKTSLMAHDEGWYATLALGMARSGDWLSPRLSTGLIYDKTSGVHWLIASAYTLFGVNETVARLPSFVAAVISICLTYAIANRITNRTVALWGALSLSTTVLWTQYSQLATQDIPLVAIELFCIWSLLQAEQGSHRRTWGFCAGLCLGLGFLIKGYMVFLAAIALLPYLIGQHRHHRHHTNLGLYAGLLAGISLVLVWFYNLWTLHGHEPFQQLFGILRLAASKDFHGVGPWYYLWNIPANLLPWTPLAIVGVIVLMGSRVSSHKWLLLGYPALLLIQLQIFPTKTLYYPLQLYPFLAIYVGIALSIAKGQWQQRPRQSTSTMLLRLISLGYGGLGAICLVLAIGLFLAGKFPVLGLQSLLGETLWPYGLPLLALGIGWLLMVGLWLRWMQNSRPPVVLLWLGSLLIGPWLALSLAGLQGLLGDYSPDVKAFCQQPKVAAVLAEHPVDFVVSGTLDGPDHKTWILTKFCTQQWGKDVDSLDALPPVGYFWLSPLEPRLSLSEPSLSEPSLSEYRVIGQIRGWQLVQHLQN